MNASTSARLSAIFLVLLAVVVGCTSESPEVSQLRAELAAANANNTALKEQLSEKERYLKLILENPDKAAYDALPKEDPISGRRDKNWGEMLARYDAFLERFPSSPLVPEVKKLKTEAAGVIRLIAEREESRRVFEEVPAKDLRDIHAYPQKYMGDTFRIKGTIGLSGVGPAWDHYHWLKADGVLILVAMKYEIARSLSDSLQGKPLGVSGEFSVRVGRDDKTSKVKYFLEEAWAPRQ